MGYEKGKSLYKSEWTPADEETAAIIDIVNKIDELSISVYNYQQDAYLPMLSVLEVLYERLSTLNIEPKTEEFLISEFKNLRISITNEVRRLKQAKNSFGDTVPMLDTSLLFRLQKLKRKLYKVRQLMNLALPATKIIPSKTQRKNAIVPK